jgi:lysophospholipase L1-like esterase
MHFKIWILTLLLLAGAATQAAETTNKFDPARFEKEIAAYEKADTTNAPPKNPIVFVGSSSIRKWTTLKQDFPKHPVMNRGFGGSVISDSIAFANRIVTPYKPVMVVFYAGDNDLGGGKTPEVVAADFKTFTEKVWAAGDKTKIAYIAIKPSIKRWAIVDKVKETNRLIEAYCKTDKRLDFIDIYPAMLGDDGKPRPELFVADGLHMTPEGYKLWTGIVEKHLPQ